MKYLVWGFVTVAIVASYARIFFGVEVTDEAYYVACAFLTSIGGKPFTNDLYFQQNASLVYEPVLRLYHLLFGSTGVILFVRHLYFLLAGACAGSFFILFRRYLKPEYAILIALLPLTFIPYCIPSLGYNTIASLCTGIGFAWTLLGFIDQKLWKSILGSLFFSAAIFGYPAFAAGPAMLWLGLLLWHWWDTKKIQWSVIGCGLLCVVLVIFYWSLSFMRFGFDNLKLSYEVTLAFGALGSVSDKITNSITMYRAYVPDLWIVLGILIVGAIARWKFLVSWLWPMVALATAFLICMEQTSSQSNIYVSFLCLMGAPALLFFKNKKSEAFKFVLALFLPSFILALAVGWTSSQILYATALASQFALMAILFALALQSSKWLVVSSLIVIQGITLFWSYDYVYRDDSVEQLSEMMSSGPYAGIMTSAGKKQLMEQIEKDIDIAKVNAKSVLFYDSFPPGYLYANLRPATLSVFIHPLPYGHLMRDLYTKYFSNPATWPDMFFQFESFPFHMNTPELFRNQYTVPPIDNFYDMLPKTGAYDMVIQRTHYKVWKRKRL